MKRWTVYVNFGDYELVEEFTSHFDARTTARYHAKRGLKVRVVRG